MTKKNFNTTYDLAVLLEKISQLLKSLPETELHDLKQLTEIVDIIYDQNSKKTSSVIHKKQEVAHTITPLKEKNNWKTDDELKNMSKEELNNYLNDKRIFSAKENLYSYANFLNIKGISRRTSKADIIDIINKNYERDRMFKTMFEAGKDLT